MAAVADMKSAQSPNSVLAITSLVQSRIQEKEWFL